MGLATNAQNASPGPEFGPGLALTHDLAQVHPLHGAGVCLSLAQVRLLPQYLRRISAIYALPWRRSTPFFHTCASNTLHLRQIPLTRAPTRHHTCAGDGEEGEVTICNVIAANGARFRQIGSGRGKEWRSKGGFGERLKGEEVRSGGGWVRKNVQKVAIIEYFYYFWQSSSVLCA